VSTTITDQARAVHRQTQPGAARDRPPRAAQSADGSPRPGSAPAGRDRPPPLRSGSTARFGFHRSAMPRRAHAQPLFNSRIDIADRQRRHSNLFLLDRIVCNDSVERKVLGPPRGSRFTRWWPAFESLPLHPDVPAELQQHGPQSLSCSVVKQGMQLVSAGSRESLRNSRRPQI
jgi:hypothetical protein